MIEPDRDMASNIADWIETFSSIATTVGYCVYHEDDMFDITGAPLEVRSFDEAYMEDETDDCEFFPEEDEAGVFEIQDDIEEDVPDDIGENVPDEKRKSWKHQVRQCFLYIWRCSHPDNIMRQPHI